MDGVSPPMVGHIEEVEDGLDPRVHVELEKLNSATNEINILEATLEEANNLFRSSLNETSSQLQSLAKRLGNCIEKARPYYETTERAKKLQIDCQRAAIQFQRANVVHQAARETIALAEERFTNFQEKESNERKFDSAWQEMLNHATMKIMEAEAQKIASEREHLQIAAAYASAQREMQDFLRSFKSAINKSRPYFHHRTATQVHLEAQKNKIHKLQKELSLAKLRYSLSLRNLEQISEEIHELRRSNNMKREPGVGAEMNYSPNFFESASNDCSDIDTKLHEEHQYWNDLRMKLDELQSEDSHALKGVSSRFEENVTGSIANAFSALPHCDTLSLTYEPHGNSNDHMNERPKNSQKSDNSCSYVKDGDAIDKILKANNLFESSKLHLCTFEVEKELSDLTIHDSEDSCNVEYSKISLNGQPLCINRISLGQELLPHDEDKESKLNADEPLNVKKSESFQENKNSECESSFPVNESMLSEETGSLEIVTDFSVNDVFIQEANNFLESSSYITCEENVQVNDPH